MNRSSGKADMRAAPILLRAPSSKVVLIRCTVEKVACHVKCLCFAPAESKIFPLQATEFALDLVL